MQEPEGLTQSRAERLRSRRSRRRKVAALGAAIVLVTAAVAGAVVWFATHHAVGDASAVTRVARGSSSASAVPTSTEATKSVTTTRVEVPDLSGLSLKQATTILGAAGLGMRVTTEARAAAQAAVVVLSQFPAAGTVTAAGSMVTIAVPAQPRKEAPARPAKKTSGHYVVVIDPGHQSHADDALEPIGPGSAEEKPRVTAGATGLSSGVPEYEVDLEIATNLKNRLEAAGVRVVMTRTTNDVDVSNAERAEIANAAKADLFVRVHADSSADPGMAGVSTLFPATNQWTKPIVGASQKAAAVIEQHLVSITGAEDGGSVARSDIAGFNWSKVPSVLVQAGYQSNAVEDRLLTSSHYQDQLAEGMTDGILVYLDGER